LIRGRIWVINGTSDAHVALAWVEVGRGLLPLFWEIRFFLPHDKQSLKASFLIVYLACGYEILVGGNSCC
jgi:hypothetical protein